MLLPFRQPLLPLCLLTSFASALVIPRGFLSGLSGLSGQKRADVHTEWTDSVSRGEKYWRDLVGTTARSSKDQVNVAKEFQLSFTVGSQPNPWRNQVPQDIFLERGAPQIPSTGPRVFYVVSRKDGPPNSRGYKYTLDPGTGVIRDDVGGSFAYASPWQEMIMGIWLNRPAGERNSNLAKVKWIVRRRILENPATADIIERVHRGREGGWVQWTPAAGNSFSALMGTRPVTDVVELLLEFDALGRGRTIVALHTHKDRAYKGTIVIELSTSTSSS